MKKLNLVLGAFLTLFILSCEGPEGPPGFDGQDGAEFEAVAFEINGVNMILNTAENRYDFLFQSYPSDITLLEDDVVLMYRLEDVVDGLNVWRQLPQPFFTDEGTLFYNFDFTRNDYSLFVEPEFDANFVPLGLVENQDFRIVIIPANLGTTSKIDTSNFNAVMTSLGLTESDVQRIKL